jgi:hypothetical protein
MIALPENETEDRLRTKERARCSILEEFNLREILFVRKKTWKLPSEQWTIVSGARSTAGWGTSQQGHKHAIPATSLAPRLLLLFSLAIEYS